MWRTKDELVKDNTKPAVTTNDKTTFWHVVGSSFDFTAVVIDWIESRDPF